MRNTGSASKQRQPTSLQELNKQFEDTLARNDLSAAKELAQAQMRQFPDKAVAAFNFWRVEKKQTPITLAITPLTKLVASYPKDRRLKIELISAYFQLGSVKKAGNLLFPLYKEDNDHVGLANLVGQFYETQDLWLDATTHYKKMHERFPDHPTPVRKLIHAAYQRGDHDTHQLYIQKARKNYLVTPANEFDWTKQNFNFEKRHFDISASQELFDRFPQDLDILKKHLLNASHVWDLQENIEKIDVLIKNKPEDIRKLRMIKINLLMRLNQFEAALEIIARLCEDTPADRHLQNLRIRCLRGLSKYEEAQEIVATLEGSEPSNFILQQKIIHLHVTDKTEEAFKFRWESARLLPSSINLSGLYHALWKRGNLGAAHFLAQSIEASSNQHLERKRLAAIHAHAIKDFKKSEQLSRDYLSVRPYQRDLILNLANSCWQQGKLNDHFYTSLFAITTDTVFISSDEKKKKTKFEELKKNISSLNKSVDHDDALQKTSQHLSLTIENPYQLKILSAVDPIWVKLINALTDLEETKKTEGLDELATSIVNHIVSKNSNPNTSSDILYRLAKLYFNSGASSTGLKYLEQSFFIAKNDAYLLYKYKSHFSKFAPRLNISSEQKLAILMVSCAPNQTRARTLAKITHQRSGFPVIILSANNQQSEYILNSTDFGYELIVPCNDDYMSLPDKLVHAYRFLSLQSNCTGILKIDDDMIPRDGRYLRELIQRCANLKSGYAGVVHEFNNGVYHFARTHLDTPESTKLDIASHDRVKFCNGGKGYYLSKNSLDIICEASLTYFDALQRNSYYEDVFFGEILSRYGIQPENVNIPLEGGFIHDIFEGYKTGKIAAPEFRVDEKNSKDNQ